MKNPLVLSLILMGAALAALAMQGCSTTAQSLRQDALVARWTLTGATNGIAEAHDVGDLKGKDYENAKAGIDQADAVVLSARAAAKQGNASSAQSYLQTANRIFRGLAGYVMGGANGN
jgi:hypothetical protein